MSDVARELAGFKPRTIVTLGGTYAGDWHVNKAVRSDDTNRDDAESRAIILQRSDASAEWLFFAVVNRGDGWEIHRAGHHGDGEGLAPIDPDAVTVEDGAER